MNKFFRFSLSFVLIFALILTGCSNTIEPPETFPQDFVPSWDNEIGPHQNIDDFFDEFFIKFVSNSPQFLSAMAYPSTVVARQDDSLNPISHSTRLWQIELAENALGQLEKFHDLSPEQQLNKDILQWSLEITVAGKDFVYHQNRLNYLTGVFNSLPSFMHGIHQVNDYQDARNYISRLEEFEDVFSQLRIALEQQHYLGLLPPDYVNRLARATMDSFVSVPVQQNLLLTSFIDKLEEVEDLTANEVDSLVADAKEVITTSIYPAYQDLSDYLRKIEGAGIGHGVWEYPQGDDYYAWIVRSFTTTDMTPQEIHDLGLVEVQRIQQEIQHVLRELGYSDNWVASLRDIYNNNRIPNRDRVLEEYNRVLAETQEILPELFGTLPQADVKIRPVPQYQEAFQANSYRLPARDGSRPGVFKINLGGYHYYHGVKSLLWHETVPGHHLQLALQQEMDLPLFRDLNQFTAFEEGWATYTELLLFDFGYDDDLYNYLGSLTTELVGAALLVVDTGIHYKRWTLKEAQEYFQTATGRQGSLERYVAWPGQVLAYHTGSAFIREQRERAMEELGDNFDIRQFHDAVLLNGSMPLSILEQQIDKYIENNR